MTPLKKLILFLIVVLLVCTPAVSALRLDFTKIGYPHPRPTVSPSNPYQQIEVPNLTTFMERFHQSRKVVDLTYTELTTAMKPNIYLYSDQDINARIRLTPETAITVSDPVYLPGEGWQAEIRHGSLNGKEDFLFYEALVPDRGWQKEEGYLIRAESREQDMAFMMGRYGFSEKETTDFVDFWASYLTPGADYVLYPQETDAVDQGISLSISPKPEEVSRIWFYAEPLASAPEPVKCPEKIVRDGFHVVEWGVLIKDE
jgi:hypothetical protein